MGMTMTQKILAKHAGLASVRAGQLIQARLDLVLGNDITTPVAVNGLTGHGVLYRSWASEYCEARFDLGEGEQLVLMVESRVEKAKDILSSDAFQAVWKGLQGSKPEI